MADHGDIDLYADVDADFGTGVADTGASPAMIWQHPWTKVLMDSSMQFPTNPLT